MINTPVKTKTSDSLTVRVTSLGQPFPVPCKIKVGRRETMHADLYNVHTAPRVHAPVTRKNAIPKITSLVIRQKIFTIQPNVK